MDPNRQLCLPDNRGARSAASAGRDPGRPRSSTTPTGACARTSRAIPWPAYHLFKIDRYTNLQPLTDGLDPNARAYTLVTSRGCPYQCIYCSKPITGNTWRARSPEDVVAEWRYLVQEMGATEIGITDDVWNLKLDRAKEICRLLIAEGLNHVPWVTVHGMRADHTDAELFQLMKQAGCKRVGFGVESGNQAVLDSIKKRQTLDDVRQAFREAKAAGLQTMGFFHLWPACRHRRDAWRTPSASPWSWTPTWPTL